MGQDLANNLHLHSKLVDVTVESGRSLYIMVDLTFLMRRYESHLQPTWDLIFSQTWCEYVICG